ncbi:MAG TPA: nitronate monooxygenase [Gaiellaceae bacterium]|nr:nitronate monooxygenase [Gaiellaceae bacterium]
MSGLENELAQRLGVRFALVQAPMAGVQPPALAAAVSNAGALGTIAGAALTADALRGAIHEVRARTGEPFAVNLFSPPYMNDDAFTVVLEEKPAAFSFTFGPVDPAPLRDAGIVVLGTATTVAEARALDVDVVVAQGAEAGGHRGTFLGSFEDALVPLAELVPEVVSAVDVPVVAAGGIMDGADAKRALALGAQGVQLGTAFLFAPECDAPPEWLAALRTRETVVTPAYSGRHARAARTPFLEKLMAGPPPLPFPEQRAAVRARPDAEGFFLGGTGAKRARDLPAAELVLAVVTGS